jgi:pimeloyl-ACP methyl ester carboxylesterase
MSATRDTLPHVEGVRHQDVEVRGARFHVAEAGEPGDGRPAVVLLHGWPQHWYEWREAMPALARAGAHVIAPDLRGFGWSEVTEHGYRKDQMAADVVAILDALGVDRFRLAGHDWGGYIAFLLGLHRSRRVERLMLLNTGHGFPKRDLKTLKAQLGFWYMPLIGTPGLGPALLRAGLPEQALRRSGEIDGAWSEEDTRIFLDRVDPHVTQQVYGSFVYAESVRSILHPPKGRLRMPTRFLHGDADTAIRPDFIRGLEDHADDYRLELLPGVGHFCVEQAPELVLPRMVDFLV